MNDLGRILIGIGLLLLVCGAVANEGVLPDPFASIQSFGFAPQLVDGAHPFHPVTKSF